MEKQKNDWIEKGLQYLYPRRCPICETILLSIDILVCQECKQQLIWIQEPKCKKCGKMLEYEQQEYCYDCFKKSHEYNQGAALWLYDTKIRDSLIRFKYYNQKQYVKFYADEIVKTYAVWLKQLNADCMVPIPIHWLKMRQRGYNQAELLALELGIRLDIPVITNLLVRNKKTVPQKELSDKERLQNLQQAFDINKNFIIQDMPNKIVLVDDIYTTGSTIAACTTVLKQRGVQEVYFICICIGRGY